MLRPDFTNSISLALANYFPLNGSRFWPNWLAAVYWGQTIWQWISLGIFLLIAFWVPYSHFRKQWWKVNNLDRPERFWQMLLPPVIAVGSLGGVSYFS